MRHGAPEGAGKLLGHSDAAPTEQGISACRERAENLAVTRIISSDLSRAQKAAISIAGDRGMTAESDARWRELDFGEWDGCHASALPANALAAFWDDPENCPPPHGERWSDLLRRIDSGLAEIGDDTLVITHAGPMRAALCVLLGLDYRQSWAFDLPYASLLSLQIWPDEPRSAQIIGLAA